MAGAPSVPTTAAPTPVPPTAVPRPVRAVRRAISEKEKEGRRTAILGAAKKVFAAKGYHATTIADIAKAAKLSYGSIYWYFDSKDALFHALMEAEGQALRRHVTAAMASTGARRSPDAPFRAAVRSTFEFFESDAALVKLLFRDSYALGDRFEQHLFGIFEEFISDIQPSVEDAQRRGLIIEAPPRMVACSVAALVGQIAHRRLVTDDGLSADAAADFVVSLLLNGLLPRSRAAGRDPRRGEGARRRGVGPVDRPRRHRDRPRARPARRAGVPRQRAPAPPPGRARVGREHHVEHDPGRRCGARPTARPLPARTEVTTIGGNSPQWLVSRAASAISAGELDATLIVGAEAQHSAKAGSPPDPGDDTGAPDPVIGDERPGVGSAEMSVGIVAPVHVYALFESVIAHRAGRRAPEQRAVLGELMARFTDVAAVQRAAWFPVVRDPTELATIGPDNRLVAEPYPKRMCAFLHVNQGAAVLVTSLATARAAGVAHRAVFCWSGAEVTDVWFPSARPDLGSSPGLRAAASAALAGAGRTVDEIDAFDLYSCFPCAVEMGTEALGIAPDDSRGLTVTGGLPYFGGPGNNYSLHAVAAMTDRLRERGGTGLVSAMGWYATKHAVGIYGASPPPTGFHRADTAGAQRAIDDSAVPVAAEARGRAVVVAATVALGRDGAVSAAPVIARLPDGSQVAAAAAPDVLGSVAGRDLVGTPVEVSGTPLRYRPAD